MASVHATFAVRSEGAFASTLIQSGESREALRRRRRRMHAKSENETRKSWDGDFLTSVSWNFFSDRLWDLGSDFVIVSGY
jgi:hypothetical protein